MQDKISYRYMSFALGNKVYINYSTILISYNSETINNAKYI